MRLSLWNYENTAFIGVINAARSLNNAEVILVAPQGDGYVNVILSMFKRFLTSRPVEICALGKEELSRGIGNKLLRALEKNYRDKKPDSIFLVSSCTAELIKIDLDAAVQWAEENIPVPVIYVPVNSFSGLESEAIDRTMLKLAEGYSGPCSRTSHPSVNIIGPSFLGFHEQSNLEEMLDLLSFLGVNVNGIFPWKAEMSTIKRIASAWANITWNTESCERTLVYLKKEYKQPYNESIPVGEEGTQSFIRELSSMLSLRLSGDAGDRADKREKDFGLSSYTGRVSNFRKSINAEQLRRKKAFVFGSFTQAAGVARFVHRELNFPVVSAGTFSTKFEERLRAKLSDIPVEVFATTDFLEVRKRITALRPDLILGTQMERHIGADLGIPCVIISPPVHLETFPLSFQPFIGWRGAAHLADLVSTPMNLGLEDDLKKMFSEDEEEPPPSEKSDFLWEEDALREMKKIPFFVRGKAKKVIEEYARRKGLSRITVAAMYEAREEVSEE